MSKEKLILLLILLGILGNVIFCFMNGQFVLSLMGLYQVILIITPLPLYLLFRKLMNINGHKVITNILPYAIAVCIVTLLITFGIVRGAYVNAPRILGILCCLYLTIFSSGLLKEKEGSGRGLKTPWSLTNKKVLHKTNRYAGKLLGFAGLVGIFTTIYLGLLYTLVLVAGCIAAVWYYSWQAAKSS